MTVLGVLGPESGRMVEEVMYGEPYRLVLAIFAFLVGACIGSFLNVVIYRLPFDRSIVVPGSHCAACGTPIPWYYNLPVVSWWWLRGRAACCGTRIDSRYWIIEFLTALLFLGLYLRFGNQFSVFLATAVFVSILIAGSGIDLDHYRIPDRFTVGLALTGLVACSLVPELQDAQDGWTGFSRSLWSALGSALGLWTVAMVGSKVFRKEAMGLGDVKLLAGIGAFLGWQGSIFVLVVSSFIGSLYGLVLVFGQKGNWGSRMPYGPFLAAAAVIWLFGGDSLTRAYVEEVRRVFAESPAFGP
jgi:leader peptidase (prepilin peptidase) / N-methyltransferase